MHLEKEYAKIHSEYAMAVIGPSDTELAFTERAEWWEPLSVQCRAFSQELLPEETVGLAG